MYGYTSRRPGVIITHIINYTRAELDELKEHNHCYDSNDQIASFCHLTEQEYQAFIDDFDITFLESKEDLKLVRKIII